MLPCLLMCRCTPVCTPQADYRMDGKVELICCSVDGEVKGYLPDVVPAAAKPVDVAMDNEKLKELNQRKQVYGAHHKCLQCP